MNSKKKQFFAVCVFSIAFLYFTIGFVNRSYSQKVSADRLKIEALFIERFTHFVKWSDDAFKSSEQNFVIGVYGKSNITPILKEVVKGTSYGSHKIVVLEIYSLKDFENVHLLYITSDYKTEILEIVKLSKSKNVLTVSNNKEVVKQGIHIALYPKNDNMKFDINLTEVKKTSLTMEYKLVELAIEVH